MNIQVQLRLVVPIATAFVLVTLMLFGAQWVTTAPVSASSWRHPMMDVGSAPIIRYITVTAGGGVIVSDMLEGQAPSTASKIVYFTNKSAGTITVTGDVTGTEPLTFTGGLGFGNNTELSQTSPSAPLVGSMAYSANAMDDSQSVLFTAMNGSLGVTTFTVDFRVMTPPTTTASVPGQYANYSPITVTWQAESTGGDLTGITLCVSTTVAAWHETGNVYTAPMTTTASGTFLYAPEAGNGHYYFAIAAHTQTSELTCPESGPGDASSLYDTISPAVQLTVPHQISATLVTVQWYGIDPGAPITGSGIVSYALAYVRDGDIHWQQTFPGTWVSTTVPVSSVHAYTFTLTAYDQAGNTGKAERVLLVAPFRVFLPLVPKNYVSYAPLVNGNFEQGLANWSYGGELSVSVVSGLYQNAQPITGTAAMLGCVDNDDPNPAHGCQYNNQGGVPIGRAMLWRGVLVPSDGNPRLTIDYRIFTHDVFSGTTVITYFDTLEIYVNTVPPAASDLSQPNRNALCRDSDTWDTSTDGLAFCDGKRSDPTKTQPPADLGWRRVTLDLGNYKSQTVYIYLANYNREDKWYNTWTYVDNVTLASWGP